MSEYITEIANDIAKSCPDLVENGCGNDNCVACLAFKLIGLGYQKQEWISVEDRLPELEDGRNWGNHRPRSIRVLCVCQQRSGKTFVKEGYYELFSNKPCWRIPGSIDTVTHWMPLPEPPKMKGGAEMEKIGHLNSAPKEIICNYCGEKFSPFYEIFGDVYVRNNLPTECYQYRSGAKHYCSYTCMCMSAKENAKMKGGAE